MEELNVIKDILKQMLSTIENKKETRKIIMRCLMKKYDILLVTRMTDKILLGNLDIIKDDEAEDIVNSLSSSSLNYKLQV